MTAIHGKSINSGESLTLIDGQFVTDEANDLLMVILAAQINFYQIKNLRSHVQLGIEDETAQREISALRKRIERCRAIVSESKSGNCALTIKAEVRLLIGDYDVSNRLAEKS